MIPFLYNKGVVFTLSFLTLTPLFNSRVKRREKHSPMRCTTVHALKVGKPKLKHRLKTNLENRNN